MDSQLKISIIIPSYKRHKYFFARAIESCLNQSYKNIEIVVVDDNAKEEHFKYRQELANYIDELSSDKVLYIQNEKNLGGSLSRNAGIEKANGEYITFLDDDDRYLKDKVKNQLEFMQEKNLEMSFTNIVIVNENEKVTDYREFSRLKSWDKNDLLEYHLTHQIAPTNTFMFKAYVLIEINGFEEAAAGQEFQLILKTINNDYKMGYCDTNDAILYRTSQECISNGSGKIKGENALYETKKSMFSKLKPSQRRFIKFRHNIVLAVVHARQKNILALMGRAFLAFFSSPISFIKEFFGFFKKRKIQVDIKE